MSSHMRVQQLLDLNRAVEAGDLARQALADDPDDDLMLALLADAEFGNKELSAALSAIEKALALKPKSSSHMAQRAYYLSHLGRHKEAEDGFREALAADPLGVFTLSARIEAILRDPRTSKRKHKDERLSVAWTCAQTLVKTYPEQAVSHIMDAKVRLAKGNFVGCEKAASRALGIQPNNSVAHQLLGLAAEAQGHTRKAGDAYVSAQKADPTSSTGLEGIRRLGKGAAAPLGFSAFLLFRLMARAGRMVSGAIAVVIVVAVIVAMIAYVVNKRRNERAEAEASLSPEARSVLEQDQKYR